MRFTNIAAVVALVASAQAFVIPVGNTDGTYAVTVGEDGVEVHTKIADAGAEVNSSSTDLEKRGDNRIWCGCGFNMNPGNTDAAVQDLKNQMGQIINPRMSFYSIRGDVVAFACSRSPRGWFVYGQMYGDKLAAITNSCGRYIAGAMQVGDDDQALIMGYQRYRNGDDFCGASTSSPANHC